MCGIVGILRLGMKPLPASEVVSRMAAAIVHRGPDDYGDYRDEYVHFGAVRLAILDLENGGQPAFDDSRSVVGILNGELYNFKDIARELTAKGHHLTSTGDTIILPHLYQERGAEMVERIRGMFAFAVWDMSERRLLICRDRMGIKPLYIARTPDFLIFGSEIKAILASGLVSPEIDRDALDDLFSLSYPCPPKTMFTGIEELLPAHRLIATATRPDTHIERYWRVPFVERGKHLKISRKDAAVELRDRIRAKVTDHLVSDVKVGTYLSGGIDSSAITALAREGVPDQLESFTISFPDTGHDEGQTASDLANRWGLKHHIVPCGPELAEEFPSSVYHTELPLQYPLALPFMKLSRAVREQGVKVILTGEGADEQMAGYDCFRLERVRGLLEFPALRRLKPFVYKRMFSWLGSPAGMAEFFLDVQRKPHREIVKEFSGVRPPWYDVWNALDVERNPLLAWNDRTARPIQRAPEGFAKLIREDIRKLHPLDAALAVELETRLPSWTVLVDDRAAMANGVETRVPFLDHELVEWIAALPPAFKLRGMEEKSLFRESMRTILPEEVRLRQKRPFYSPIKEWFFSDRRPAFVDEILSEQALRDTELFVPSVVTRLRKQLDMEPDGTLLRHRLEWLMILVLGTQSLSLQMVQGVGKLHRLDHEQLLRRVR